ncbi:IS66 family insertion sequence element accessory protein TnpB [Pseudomonas sp. CBS]|uniref:IS66 family insertion sequence element accessory protein TnpB n=1 Tax=Pseudomonas sp. CBS TaxID=2971912 RepID=UPI0035C985BD
MARHRAYLFANHLATRTKVLVHDGVGVWLAARRLNKVNSIGHALGKAAKCGWIPNSFKP